MKKNILFFVLAFCFQNHIIFSQTINPELLEKIWQAQWIEVPDEPDHNYGIYHFRKTLELKEKPTSFIVHVSGDNRYKFFVNGRLVCFGPAKGDLFHWNFETIDIAPFLTSGKNILAAVVWNFGKYKPENQISHQTGFILQGNGENEKIANTNNSWKSIKNDSYQPLKPDLVNSYYVAGPGEKIDFNLYPSDWETLAFDDSGWKNASTVSKGLPKGVFDWSNDWMLVPRTIPFLELKAERMLSVREAQNITFPKQFPAIFQPFKIPANTKISAIIDQGYLTNAYPVLKFAGGKNSVVSISYAEALFVDEGNSKNWKNQNQKGNRNETSGKRFVGVKDEIISNGKEGQEFTTLNFRTYRYIKLEIETKGEPLQINDLYGNFTGYPFERKAIIATDNPEIIQMADVGWKTARLCAIDTYIDCPYYEQLQYIGDTRIQALVSLYNTGDDRLMRNAISQLDNSRMAEGLTLSRFPTANHQEIPPFSLWWIGMLHDYWMYRQDDEFVKSFLPGSRQVLNWFHRCQNDNGSLKKVPYWNFTDWSTSWDGGRSPSMSNGQSAALDLQILWAYQLAYRLEESLGMKSYAESYKIEMEKLKSIIVKKYWNEEKKMFSDTPEMKHFSQHTNTLAILTEVISGNEAKELIQKTLADKSLAQATIYFKYYVFQALAKVGLGDQYISLLTDWRKQLSMGMTTWAEISDVNVARSDCHAWGASPNIEFFRIVLGIDTQSPGFRKVKIEPNLGNLQSASGSIPHPNGEISVNYQLDKKGKWKVEILIPKETTGIFIWKGKSYDLISGEKMIFNL